MAFYMMTRNLSAAHPVSFAANTFTLSIDAGLDHKSATFAINAAAIGPSGCASRPAASGNASKMANVDKEGEG